MIRIDPANRVSFIGCRPGILAALPTIEAVCQARGYVVHLTSGADGVHGPGSLHPPPHGLAVDVAALSPAVVQADVPTYTAIRREIAERLGVGFDVILEFRRARPTHIHVERDAKKRPLEPWEMGS